MKTILTTLIALTFAITSFATDSTFTYTDGPHVIYKNDSVAQAYYLCEHGLNKQIISFNQATSFSGLCCDASNSYTFDEQLYIVKDAQFSNVSKFIALSDIHGEYDALVQFLISANVIDENKNWIFGDGHLIFVGDIFDRGDQVTECLWLINHMELQAEKQNGMVHYLIGNHDQMVMINDLRYVNERYIKGIARKSRISYTNLFGPDTHFGRWLRSKHTIVKINDILFVHAGVSPELIDAGYTINSVNNAMRQKYDQRSTKRIFDDTTKFLYSSLGPLWYRGFHYEMEDRYPMATTEEIDRATEYFGATHIVVGHTGVDSLTTLFDKRLIGIDIDLELLGSFEGLLWENNQLFRIKSDGQQASLY